MEALVGMLIIPMIIAYIVLCIVVGYVAESRGRTGVGWFFLTFFLFTPIFALFVLLVARDYRREKLEAERHAEVLFYLGKPATPSLAA
jgi:hypothetical protein